MKLKLFLLFSFVLISFSTSLRSVRRKTFKCEDELKTSFINLLSEPDNNFSKVADIGESKDGNFTDTNNYLKLFFDCINNKSQFSFMEVVAPYRNDFYVRENVIGYTGKLREMDEYKGQYPTIYFYEGTQLRPFSFITRNNNQKISFIGYYGRRGNVGRITQQHPDFANVGRQSVHENIYYVFGNYNGKGAEFFYSRQNGPLIAYHFSRNYFTKISFPEDENDINKLLTNINSISALQRRKPQNK